jgi:ferrous iron transport protein B
VTPSSAPSPTPSAPAHAAPAMDDRAGPVRIALLGNPNTGKTTLFNRLSGLRHKTSNFPGTTLEARLGRIDLPGADGGPPRAAELIDLPGIYSLELDQLESAMCRDVLAGTAAPRGDVIAAPDAVLVVLDATNLSRNLVLAGEALRRRLPTVVAVNMIDLARRAGVHIDAARLGEVLGCRVVLTSARSGEGLAELTTALAAAQIPSRTPPGDEAGLRQWADDAYEAAATIHDDGDGGSSLTDHLDHAFTHPVLGVAVFAIVMTGLFYGLFTLAQYPMEWIEAFFTWASGAIAAVMPEGILRDLLANGIVQGVGATVVFLPQICLLFFLISLLEDTGYLARAAFVMNRVLRPFGLPGHSFVPLLSAHACALPGIMAARAIPDRRERLATILVAPFMTCSARLPVYVLLIGVLFRDQPARAALAFVGCYALGILAGVGSALLARRTILRGKTRPMALELPSYKMPSIRTALLTTWDRGLIFVRKAGTVILTICIVLWWLGAYPHVPPPQEAEDLRARAAAIAAMDPSAEPAGDEPTADDLLAEADAIEARHAAAHSFIGRLGHAAEPVFRPLGYDWQLTIGVLSSFAAREVFVSTMAVVVAGADDAEDETVRQRLVSATREDGRTPIFTAPAAWSLLVFYVLAMQCLPTLAVTAREAGGVRWALLQLAWMSGVAYAAAFITYRIASAVLTGDPGAGG